MTLYRPFFRLAIDVTLESSGDLDLCQREGLKAGQLSDATLNKHSEWLATETVIHKDTYLHIYV